MRQFYRLVFSNPPQRDDFRSDRDLGEPQPPNATPEILRMWEGVSFRSNENQARKLALALQRKGIHLGSFIAEVEVSDDGIQ